MLLLPCPCRLRTAAAAATRPPRARAAAAPRPRPLRRARAGAEPQGSGGGGGEPQRDEDGLILGVRAAALSRRRQTYSSFFSSWEQPRAVAIFCAVLAAFFSLGNVGAAVVLPILYNKPIELCFQAIVLGYPC